MHLRSVWNKRKSSSHSLSSQSGDHGFTSLCMSQLATAARAAFALHISPETQLRVPYDSILFSSCGYSVELMKTYLQDRLNSGQLKISMWEFFVYQIWSTEVTVAWCAEQCGSDMWGGEYGRRVTLLSHSCQGFIHLPSEEGMFTHMCEYMTFYFFAYNSFLWIVDSFIKADSIEMMFPQGVFCCFHLGDLCFWCFL